MDGNLGSTSDAFAWARERQRLLWAVRVRWAVIIGFGALATALHPLGLFPRLWWVLAAGMVGVAGNGINHLCVRRGRGVVAATVLALLMDNALITYAAASTGGFHSPMMVMYSIQVVATAMLVTTQAALWSAAAAAIGAAALAYLAGARADQGSLLYSPSLAADPALAAGIAALAWVVFLAYGLSLLVFVGGFVSERLRRSEGALAAQNLQLARTVASLETARDEVASAYQRLQQAEAQLVHTEKMRALGQLVAGVAHELNNPISFVSSNIDILRRYATQLLETVQRRVDAPLSTADRQALEPVVADLPGVLDDCEEGARRVKRIVGELRQFSRRDDDGVPADVDVNACLERTLRLLRHLVCDGVRLDTSLGEIPPIVGSAGQLEQVFLNLVSNALDAVGNSGVVRISSRHAADDGTVRVAVADDGPGIAAENLERVFEPFFTTKPVGQGTGLGLSLSYAIVQKHGGRLTVTSAPGRGANFEVAIPCRERVKSSLN